MTDMVERAADAVEKETATARPLAIARAALLAALDPEDEVMVADIACEIAGGSADEADAVEMEHHVRLVLRELRRMATAQEPQP